MILSTLIAALKRIALTAIVVICSTANSNAVWIADADNGCLIWWSGSNDIEKASWSGACLDGKAEGNGESVFQWRKDGQQKSSIYRGQVSQGKRNGLGVRENSSGSTWEGTFVDHRLQGLVSVKYADGAIFKGMYVNDRRKGYGTYTWPDGMYYAGQWDSIRNGDGVLYRKNGSRYVGQWKNDKMHGRGVSYRSMGTVVVGLWEENKLTSVIDIPGLTQGKTDVKGLSANAVGISSLTDISTNASILATDQVTCLGVPPIKNEEILRPLVRETELNLASRVEEILDRASVACHRALYQEGLESRMQRDLRLKQAAFRLLAGNWSGEDTLNLLKAAHHATPQDIQTLQETARHLGWLKEQLYPTTKNEVLLSILRFSVELNLSLVKARNSARDMATLASDVVYLVDIERGLGLPGPTSRAKYLKDIFHELQRGVQTDLIRELALNDAAVVYTALGKIEMQREHYPAASAWFEQAMELVPDAPILPLNLSMSLAYEGKSKLAASTYLEFQQGYFTWLMEQPDAMPGTEYLNLGYRDYYYELLWVLATGKDSKNLSRFLLQELMASYDHFEAMGVNSTDYFRSHPAILAAVQARLGNFQEAVRQNNRTLDLVTDRYSRKPEFESYGRSYAKNKLPKYKEAKWPRNGLLSYNGYDFFLPNQVFILQSNYFRSLNFNDTDEFQVLLDMGQPLEQSSFQNGEGTSDLIEHAKRVTNRHFAEMTPSFLPTRTLTGPLVQLDQRDLWDALNQSNNADQIRYVIENGVNPNSFIDLAEIIPAINGMTNALVLFEYLELAGKSCKECVLNNLVQHKNTDVAQFLISKGLGETSLMIRSGSGLARILEPTRLEIMKQAISLDLLHPSALIAGWSSPHPFLVTSLITDGSADQVEALLSFDVDLSSGSRKGNPNGYHYDALKSRLDRRARREPSMTTELDRMRRALARYAASSGTRRGNPRSDIATQTGQFNNGILVDGTTIFRDGRMLSGSYDQDGRPHGSLVYADKDGLYGQVSYQNGQRTGIEILTDPSGFVDYQHRSNGRVDTPQYRQTAAKSRVAAIEQGEFSRTVQPLARAAESARIKANSIREDRGSALGSIYAESSQWAGKCSCELGYEVCLYSYSSANGSEERAAAERRRATKAKACRALAKAGIYVSDSENIFDVLRNIDLGNPSLDTSMQSRLEAAKAAIDEADRLDALATAKARERKVVADNLRQQQEQQRQARIANAASEQLAREIKLKAEAKEKYRKWASCISSMGFDVEDIANWHVAPDC